MVIFIFTGKLYSRSQFAIRTREPLYVTSPVGVFLLLLKHLNALPSSVVPASGRCARSARSAQIITLNIFCELTKRYSISPAASVWVSALNLLCDGEIFANFVRNLRKPPTLPIKLNSIYFSKRLWKGSQGVLVGFTKMTFEIRSSFRITFYCLWLLRPLLLRNVYWTLVSMYNVLMYLGTNYNELLEGQLM